MEIGALIGCAKESAGLSIRKLSSEARVAGTTFTRIQTGAVDPSIQTLQRILDAAGFDLHVAAIRHGTPHRPRLSDLATAWTLTNGRLRLDWTRWRALLDELALHRELVPEAIYGPPPPAGDRIVDSLLAAVAEKLADDYALPRPAWTFSIPALDEPFQPLLARPTADHAIPDQLLARNLMVDTESLWRNPETVGV
jgi:transcriptional regulator with XRE-family HTH domain